MIIPALIGIVITPFYLGFITPIEASSSPPQHFPRAAIEIATRHRVESIDGDWLATTALREHRSRADAAAKAITGELAAVHGDAIARQVVPSSGFLAQSADVTKLLIAKHCIDKENKVVGPSVYASTGGRFVVRQQRVKDGAPN